MKTPYKTNSHTKTDPNLFILILAAGKSTRFPGNKLFQPLLNQPVLYYSIKKALKIAPNNTFLMLSKATLTNQEEQLKKLFPTIKIVYQDQKNECNAKYTGTGAAVESFLDYNYHNQDSKLLVLYGDNPLIEESTLQSLITQNTNALLSFSTNKNNHYGKILTKKSTTDTILNHDTSSENNISNKVQNNIQASNEQIIQIVEYKDPNYNQVQTAFYNSGIVFFHTSLSIIHKILKTLPIHHNQEKYLTDVFSELNKENHHTIILNTDQEECLGINTLEDFHLVQKILNYKLIKSHIQNGVFIHNPDQVTLSFDTILEPGCQIHPYTIFGPACHIKSTATILPFSYITQSKIGGIVGPFAHIRENTITESNTHLGAFVETKEITLGQNSKAKHHAYLGNITVGANTNIGAGVIVCNYNKQKKEKTDMQIGNNCDIGANSCLISPLNIDSNSQIGAGSVISKNVPENTLAVSRSSQKNLPILSFNLKK